MKQKIFISYDYDNDKEYKNMLLAWDKNQNFDFDFEDGSADVSIESNDTSTIKRGISAKINQSDIFLCLIGELTHKSKWVKWEIEKAIELGKRIVVVKIKREYETPEELKNVGVTWAMSFTFKAIKEAVDECSQYLNITTGAGTNANVKPSSPWSS